MSKPVRSTEVEDQLNNQAMTVSQLIAHLEDLGEPDAVVVFVSNYGDIGRTQQTIPVEEVDLTTSEAVSRSAYSISGLALDDDWMDYANEHMDLRRDDDTAVVLLK